MHVRRARLATRLAFLIAGFGIACWAPLVPFAKQRLGADDGTLGLLLLCIGVGSVLAMQIAGAAGSRYGVKPAIIAGGLGVAAVLPALCVLTTAPALGAALLVFGAALGSLDVSMNIHALEVERAAGTPLMSGFHALYSLGGFAGSAMMTLLLSAHVTPVASTVCCAALVAAATLLAWPRLLAGPQGEPGPIAAWPRGIVLLLSGLAAAMFLVEGALLDWSALLLTSSGAASKAAAGAGYMLFTIAMTTGRLTGDAVTARLGNQATLAGSGVLTVAGFVVLLLAPVSALALAGFVLIGLGAANIVPILFRAAGMQTIMPPALAISAMTTLGYAGILAGPAIIGFVSDAAGLRTAFWILATLVCSVPLLAGYVARTAAGPGIHSRPS